MLMDIKIAKLNNVHSFDVETLPKESLEYAIRYGLTQAVNDAHASVARKDYATENLWLDEVQVKVNKRIEQIESGNVPGARGPADPNAAKARKLVKDLGGMSDEDMAVALAAVQKARSKRAA